MERGRGKEGVDSMQRVLLDSTAPLRDPSFKLKRRNMKNKNQQVLCIINTRALRGMSRTKMTLLKIKFI